MNRSELESMSRKQLMAMAERAGLSVRRGLGKAALVELLLSAPPQAPAELPASYGRTRLTLVEIEPHWIHAYWEVTAPDCEAARAKVGAAEAAWVLRFYDVTGVEFDGGNARDSFDVPVDVAAGNWYVNLWSGGKTYCAEIGLRAEGAFVPVGRSGVVQVPAAAAAPTSNAEWMKVEPLTGETASAEEPAHEEMPASVATADATAKPEPLIVGAALLPAAELPVRVVGNAEPREFPNVGVAPSGGADEPKSPAEAGTPTEPRDAQSQPQATTARAELPKDFPLPPPPAAAEFGAAETNRWCEELHSPPGSNGNGNDNGHAPAESPAPQAESAPSSHSVERFGTSSGGFGAAEERAPSIKLELNAEVVIYGRAMPGQTVEVCGRSVKVNPDGTFSVRMALPLADDVARPQ